MASHPVVPQQTPPPPAGFQLDTQQSGAPSQAPPPPPGFALDQQQAPAQAAQPADNSAGTLSDIWRGVKESQLGQMVQSGLTPPQDSKEHLVWTIASEPGLQAYRQAKGLLASITGMTGEGRKAQQGKNYAQYVQDVQQAIDDYHKGRWQNIAGSATSLIGDTLQAGGGGVPGEGERVRELGQGMRAGGNLATPVTKDLADLALLRAGGEEGEAGTKGGTRMGRILRDPETNEITKLTDLPRKGLGKLVGNNPEYVKAQRAEAEGEQIKAQEAAQKEREQRYTKEGEENVAIQKRADAEKAQKAKAAENQAKAKKFLADQQAATASAAQRVASGVRPGESEAAITNVIRSTIVTPEEFAAEQRLLGRKEAVLQPDEGTMERETRLLGTVRGRRVAKGMREPDSVELMDPDESSTNASGESAASQEAIKATKADKAAGVRTIRIDTRSGKETPVNGIDARDAKAGPFELIVRRMRDGEQVIDRGAKARDYHRTRSILSGQQ